MRLLLVCLAALVLAAPAAARTDAPRPLTVSWPVDGTLTSPFGWREGNHHHPGIDIGILQGLTVTAAAPGYVTRVGYQPGYSGYGFVVELSVAPGYTTLYAHLSSASVRRGQYVTAGTPLGVAGCTGWCTGTHLHFELRRRGVAIDPWLLVRAP